MHSTYLGLGEDELHLLPKESRDGRYKYKVLGKVLEGNLISRLLTQWTAIQRKGFGKRSIIVL